MGRVIEYAVVIVVLVAGCSMLLPQQSPQAQMSDANYWNGNPGADTAGAGLRLVAATGEALTAAADLFFNGTAALNTVSTSSPASRVCMGAVLFAVIPFGVLSWVTLGVWRRIFRRYL